MDSLSDAQLIKRTIQRRGDASLAFARLYGRYQHKVAAYVGAKVNYNHALVDDVLQDSFMTAWNKLEQLHDANKFFPWLVTIARNTAMDVLRDKKRVEALSSLLSLDEEVAEPELDLGETEQILLLLEPIEREIVVMKAVLEYSLEEIAIQLSLKLSATKMRYYRALDKLKAELAHLP